MWETFLINRVFPSRKKHWWRFPFEGSGKKGVLQKRKHTLQLCLITGFSLIYD
jgi:hypothetical protein